MANLPESNTWETGVYQLEITDIISAGVDGISNIQALQLANRTNYLKNSPTFDGNVVVVGSVTVGVNPSSNMQVATKQYVDSFSHASPACCVAAFARYTAPDGWLVCNGAEVPIANYPLLASAMYCGDALNSDTTVLFGYKTNGSGFRLISGTHIKIPDLRGEFIRGWISDRVGFESGRVFGSLQTDSNKTHTHFGTTGTESTQHTHPGGYDHSYTWGTNDVGGGSWYYPVVNTGTQSTQHTHNITTGTNSDGGMESHPRNVTLLYCIKVS